MDDIQAKYEFVQELKRQGLSGQALIQAIEQYDAMDEAQQEQARAALTQLHLQGSVPVPAQDQQDNEKNALASRRIQEGTYDPERDSFTPEGLRSQADQKRAELYASMGLADPTPGVIQQIERHAQAKPEVQRSSLIVKGSYGHSRPILKAPKVKP